LKYKVALGLVWVTVAVNHLSRGGLFQSGQHPQQRRFPTPARTHDHAKLIGKKIQGHALQGNGLCPVQGKRLAQVLHPELDFILRSVAFGPLQIIDSTGIKVIGNSPFIGA
jgi:hypothetical protein